MTIEINNVIVVGVDRSFRTRAGSVRPSTPLIGMIWYNTSLTRFEFYDGTEWKPVIRESAGKTVWTWGFNANGQLGDITTTNKSSPVSIVGGINNWTQISAGKIGQSIAGIRGNGTAWAWGSNIFGQLGDNTLTTKSSPVIVAGGFTDWTDISSGRYHTLGIRANGTAWGWGGRGYHGQVGDGTTALRSSPVSVVGGFTDWIKVSGGTYHSAGIRANGTIWAWGLNNKGQLGDGTTTNKSSPVSVVGGFTDWIQLSSGYQHTTAIRANGTAWGWGTNEWGQLGDNTTASKTSPVSVVGGFSDWTQTSCGSKFTAAIRANGTAWCWGRGQYGNLGNGSNTSSSSPVSVVGGFTDWIQISAGGYFAVGLRSNGTAWAWGYNSFGRLGDGTTTNRSSPVSVIGGFTDWIQVEAAGFSQAGIRS